jgi:hypothetical protein
MCVFLRCLLSVHSVFYIPDLYGDEGLLPRCTALFMFVGVAGLYWG